MYETIDFTIRGLSPLMMHNGRLSDPLNEFSKALKEITGKRKKTDADHHEMSRIEFLGGLYTDEKGHPGIPGENIEAMLINAAKKHKLGTQAKAGILSDGFWRVKFEGPKTPDALWLDKRFVDRRGAGVQGSRVNRTRPIFHDWQLSFTVSFLPDQLNEKDVRTILETAGRIVGCGDYRPKFGRFEIQSK